ncbi:hypothetical protein QJS04_geneDACA015138 [Acorus gramineus]|uniref:Disease resistance N-terminal domain-containing protein n=1 Tax=Acorus gramineus TaxID=55184 RepID=A0AAV9BSZ0_ACOGR|nr:hypothetical protein QJS04_geneDACA015138 [Acorus gramineus]
MAEAAAVTAVIGVLQQLVGSGLAKGFGLIRGVDGELEKLESNFSAIQAVLADAEEQRVKNRTLEDWLKKVRDVAYRADNVLDEFHIEALRRREAETGNHMLKNVS